MIDMEFEEIATENRLSSHLPAAPSINHINGGDNDDHDHGHDGDITRRRRTVVSDQRDINEVDHDVTTKLGAAVDKRLFIIDSLIKHIENDNLRLLQRQKQRIDRVDVEVPNIEVRYNNLSVEAECEVVEGKPLPTLWNTAKGFFSGFLRLTGLNHEDAKIVIIKNVSGIIKPSRLTLLLGPPGCGKTTFLQALAGKLDKSLKVCPLLIVSVSKDHLLHNANVPLFFFNVIYLFVLVIYSLQVTGEVSYNGYKLDEFIPGKTSSYVSQHDLHIPEMTVRETLDFSARFQGVGCREEILDEVCRKEKQAGIVPEPEIDTYMKAISVKGLKTSIQTDYVMKIMGMDICADIMVGDAMRRGISGGQKKRLTTAEVIVGPTKALFMDEISTGLDSSTTFQIVTCLQQMAHISEATIVISLLQPAPETYDLFDDIILMAEGKIVYQGPRDQVLAFFGECGFRCPERKGEADFLQEVLSRRDQEQYWYHPRETYTYVSVDGFCKQFKLFCMGKNLEEELSKSFDKSQSHKNALSFNIYSLPKWELFKACTSRELLLMKRNSFTYIFKISQLAIMASICMSVFLRSDMVLDVVHADHLMSSLFFTIMVLMVNGLPELTMTVSRLPCFYKQRDFHFYPAWAYAIPATISKIPISLIESLIWTSVTYYGIGYSPEPVRFFRQFLILFVVHQVALSIYRCLAACFRTMVPSIMFSTMMCTAMLTVGGFLLPKPSIPGWLRWGFWVSPFTYTQIGLTVNEFLAPRWQKVSALNTTIGNIVLKSHGLDFESYFYWVALGALLGFAFLFNLGFVLALTFSRPIGKSCAIISREKLSQINGGINDATTTFPENPKKTKRRMMVLPFQPFAMTFQDICYYVDTPPQMREQGYTGKKLQLLHNITGAFRPGILSVLMGVSGAGKTTLLDVLSGRKTGGAIEGDIRIGGYPKMQETFARISGYCEQTDIHSPQITVEESVIFSAWLRLPNNIDSKTRSEFVNDVLETIELDDIKDALVGTQGVNGLSTEQRKRLTIAVELVANPSILFMDEPTSGLDARAAAIVMRAVKNVADTGRTVVCTIHQPSIDIFEAFDELILMKMGGRLIYSGPLGQHSSKVVEYFESIRGVPKIKDNQNPAAWILEVTSASAEAQLEVNFAQIYKESTLYNDNKELVKQLNTPPPGSKDLHFLTRFPQNEWVQFSACLWKQYLSYWRSPSYNLVRLIFILFVSLVMAALFWKQGKTLNNQQSLFNILGSMNQAVLFNSINNCALIMPFVVTERVVLYREKFAGMYSPWAYSFAQVVIEIPCAFIQALLFTILAYPTIGYYWSAYKFLWFLYTMFCSILSFVYLGMLLASLTPNLQMATISSSFFYQSSTLFSGFILSGPYGDIQQEITVFGETKTVADFLQDYFGFQHDRLRLVALVLLAFPLLFASLFAYCIGKLNFQRR
ncbi:pleiotropic drug resistance protein 3-like isoform X2 [Dioscorea cayenensis subsp. rotundata]|uniref:Pleiotropic drug resistance protein 3-like isoform X2 n=1 Tax=Dioscorea cayennensis subsp. rotundata TaxID=55577 RepID=A0AB40AH05_DIOCR|nr:pleiotropic drug resistance protein 3-like isoform X2 [Dioscorea cayenensis subsp. rotundata]